MFCGLGGTGEWIRDAPLQKQGIDESIQTALEKKPFKQILRDALQSRGWATILSKVCFMHSLPQQGKVQCGTAPCLKGMPDVKMDCKTVTILFINTAAQQGKRPLATYSP